MRRILFLLLLLALPLGIATTVHAADAKDRPPVVELEERESDCGRFDVFCKLGEHCAAFAESTVKGTFGFITTQADPTFSGKDAKWFRDQYGMVMPVAFLFALLFTFLALGQALFRGDGGLVMGTITKLLAAILGAFLIVGLTQVALEAITQLSQPFVNTMAKDTTAYLAQLLKPANIVRSGSASLLLGMFMTLLIALAAILVFAVMVIRALAIYCVLLFIPFALAAIVWPSLGPWFGRMLRVLGVLIVSKLGIVILLSTGAKAMKAFTVGGDDTIALMTSGIMGAGTLLVAAATPWILMTMVGGPSTGAALHGARTATRGAAAGAAGAVGAAKVVGKAKQKWQNRRTAGQGASAATSNAGAGTASSAGGSPSPSGGSDGGGGMAGTASRTAAGSGRSGSIPRHQLPAAPLPGASSRSATPLTASGAAARSHTALAHAPASAAQRPATTSTMSIGARPAAGRASVATRGGTVAAPAGRTSTQPATRAATASRRSSTTPTAPKPATSAQDGRRRATPTVRLNPVSHDLRSLGKDPR